jgi:hypothetical protein
MSFKNMISPTENSVSPPSGKRQKTLSDKDADKCDDASQQVVIYIRMTKVLGDKMNRVQTISQLNKQNQQSHESVHWESNGAFAAQCNKCQKW